MSGRGDAPNGEDGGYGEDLGGAWVGRVGISGAEGVRAAGGEVALLEEVDGGGEEPAVVGFGLAMTRLALLGTHLWRKTVGAIG